MVDGTAAVDRSDAGRGADAERPRQQLAVVTVHRDTTTAERDEDDDIREFKDLAQRGTFVPVYKEIVADLLTPVSAFLKIAEHSDYAFLLESVEGGEQVGRYSFLGKDPFLILRSRGGKTIIERAGADDRVARSRSSRRCAS